MSDYDKPNPPKLNFPNAEQLQDTFNDIRAKAQETLNQQPPEVQEKVEQSKSFYERNRKTILTGVVVVVGLRVYKKKIAKTTAKVVAKTIKSDTAIVDHLNQLTLAVEDLAQMAHDVRFGTDTFLRSAADAARNK